MAPRILGPTGGRRRKRLVLLLPFVVIAALLLVIGASASVSSDAGFEGADGNLANNGAIDWNDFDAGTNGWLGTAPLRTRAETVSGWKFNGLEDYQNDGNDTVFAGGVKQDDECAKVQNGPKPPNKDDLKRVYFASKQVGGNTFLGLAWERIPQNTTSASAHVAFEFNRDDPHNACGGNSNGLVHRSVDLPAVAGDQSDMLIVYDFEGGTSTPQLKLSRWIASGSCEVGSDSPPCWGQTVNLTAGGFADAKVNTEDASDVVAPADDTLHSQEFGEAIINLTAAGVFSSSTCTSFGKAYAVSRSSGNSSQAQMKDLVGPGDVSLSNCGQIKVIKRTNPRDLNQDFNFSSNIESSATKSCSADSSPNAFVLNDGQPVATPAGDNSSNTEDCTSIQAGSYFVKESSTDPSGFGFASVSCTTSGGASYLADAADARKINITLVGNSVITCTYINDQLTGAIAITKTAKDKSCQLDGQGNLPSRCSAVGVAKQSGVTFDIKDGSTTVGSPATNASGVACLAGLTIGTTYTVHEVVPSNYTGQADKGVSVTATGDCTSGAATTSFVNSPLSKLQVIFTSSAGSGITAGTIDCEPNGGSVITPDGGTSDEDNSYSGLAIGDYTCNINIDP
jgi:hypothetical protein